MDSEDGNRTYEFSIHNDYEPKRKDDKTIEMKLTADMLTNMGFISVSLGNDTTSCHTDHPTPYTKKYYVGISGGGFRALSSHIGAFRALNNRSVLSTVDMVSAVSGGSWFLSKLMFDENFAAKVLGNADPVGDVVSEWLENIYFASLHRAKRSPQTTPTEVLRSFITTVVTQAPGVLTSHLGTGIIAADYFEFSWQNMVETSVLGKHVATQQLEDTKLTPATRSQFSAACTFALNWIQLHQWGDANATWFLKRRNGDDLLHEQHPVYTSALYKQLGNDEVEADVKARGNDINELFQICHKKKWSNTVRARISGWLFAMDAFWDTVSMSGDTIFFLWGGFCACIGTAGIIVPLQNYLEGLKFGGALPSFVICVGCLCTAFLWAHVLPVLWTFSAAWVLYFITSLVRFLMSSQDRWRPDLVGENIAPYFESMKHDVVDLFGNRRLHYIDLTSIVAVVAAVIYFIGSITAAASVGVIWFLILKRQFRLIIGPAVLLLACSWLLWTANHWFTGAMDWWHPTDTEDLVPECGDFRFDFDGLTVGQVASASSAAVGGGAVQVWMQNIIELARQSVRNMVAGANVGYCQVLRVLVQSAVSQCNAQLVTEELLKVLGCSHSLFGKREDAASTAARWSGFLEQMAIAMKLSDAEGKNARMAHTAIDAVRTGCAYGPCTQTLRRVTFVSFN